MLSFPALNFGPLITPCNLCDEPSQNKTNKSFIHPWFEMEYIHKNWIFFALPLIVDLVILINTDFANDLLTKYKIAKRWSMRVKIQRVHQHKCTRSIKYAVHYHYFCIRITHLFVTLSFMALFISIIYVIKQQ